MKRILPVLLSACLLFTFQYTSLAFADSPKPTIRIELGDYQSDAEHGFFSADTIRHGRDKTSAMAGERVVVTFILSGIDSLEYFQLSGSFDTDLLCPSYYSGTRWTAGDSDMDFSTVVDGCSDFGITSLDSSFSYTRTDYDPMLYACGYSQSGSVSLDSQTVLPNGVAIDGVPLVSFGFEVLGDIDNIYNAIRWDVSGTTLSQSIDGEEYTLGTNLTIACPHQYEATSVDGTCENEGYTLYGCTICNDEFMTNFVPSGHLFSLNGIDGNTFSYTCSRCGENESKSIGELQALWDIAYVNKAPEPMGKNPSSLLDVVQDNIINAKDFSVINN